MSRWHPDNPRLFLFRRIYQHRSHWYAMMQDRGMSDVLTCPSGEQVCFYDLLEGIETLSPRQCQAFVLICLLSYTEVAARDALLPGLAAATVGQYANAAMEKLMDIYDHGIRV